MELGYGVSPAALGRFFSKGKRPFLHSKFHALKPRMSSSSSSFKLENDVTVLDGLKDLVDPMKYKADMSVLRMRSVKVWGFQTFAEQSFGFGERVSSTMVWLLDQFGVLHDGQKAYPGAVETLHRIAQTGVKLVIISNSSRRATSTYERMQSLGFDSTLFTGIITSGELTHDYLLRRHDPWFAALGHKCIHITWSERSSISLKGLGLEIVEDPELADFVLVHGTEALGVRDGGIKPATVTEIGTVLSLAAGRGLPMVVANPDLVTVEARDLMIMPGSLGLQYEKIGGYVKYMGKPDSVIYKAAAEMTGFQCCDMVAVGDSLFHDIQGAMKNSIDSVFVAGGIHARDLGISSIGDQPNPDDLQFLLKAEGFYPTYVVPMFSW